MNKIERIKVERDVRILEGSIEALEEYGWTQGTMGNTEVGYCATGAVSRAGRIECHGDITYQEHCRIDLTVMGALRRLSHKLNTLGYDPAIVRFNDHIGRTRAEVLRIFRKTLADTKAEL